MSVQRYDVGGYDWESNPDDLGDWVLWEDHVEEVERLNGYVRELEKYIAARVPIPDDLVQVCDLAFAYLDLADASDVDLETVALVRATLPKETE